MKKVLIILLILIVLFVGIRENLSNKGSRTNKYKRDRTNIYTRGRSTRGRSTRGRPNKYTNRYNRNRRNIFNNYRNSYLNYYPILYPSLRTNCKWIKVCDDDLNYY